MFLHRAVCRYTFVDFEDDIDDIDDIFETGSGKGLHLLQRKLCLSQRYVGGSMPNQQACKHEETA